MRHRAQYSQASVNVLSYVNILERPSSVVVYLQIALDDSSAVCRQLKAELADGQHRQAVLVEERDDHEAQKRSLQAALVDARARGLEADLKGTGLPRYTHYITYDVVRRCPSNNSFVLPQLPPRQAVKESMAGIPILPKPPPDSITDSGRRRQPLLVSLSSHFLPL